MGKTLKRSGVLDLRLLGATLVVVSLFNLSAPAEQAAPETIIADSLAASVQLYAERDGGVHRWGSGVAFSRDGVRRMFILTAAHLVVPPESQTVYAITPGSDVRTKAAILAIDEKADVAILAADDLAVTPIAMQETARLGDNVWVISFPWGRRGTVVSGVVSQIAAEETDTRLPISGPVSLIDAAVSYGTSGGGVFDAQTGRLVGIVRGYRTAKLALPGAPAQSLDLPIAGETTVVSTATIRCLIARTALDEATKMELLGASPTVCTDL